MTEPNLWYLAAGSLCTVTNRPEVVSNCYHLSFIEAEGHGPLPGHDACMPLFTEGMARRFLVPTVEGERG